MEIPFPASQGWVAPWGGDWLGVCELSLTLELPLSLQLFAMIFAMCLFRGIQ